MFCATSSVARGVSVGACPSLATVVMGFRERTASAHREPWAKVGQTDVALGRAANRGDVQGTNMSGSSKVGIALQSDVVCPGVE